MKKRAAALLISCTLMCTSLMQVSASDFEEQSPETASYEQTQTSVDSELFTESETSDSLAEQGSSDVGDVPAEDEAEGSSTDLLAGDLYGDEFDMDQNEEENSSQESLPEEDFTDDFMDETLTVASLEDSQWEEVTDTDGSRKFRYVKSDSDEKILEYYTWADGLVDIAGNQYLFDEDGYLITGRTAFANRYVFLMDEENAVVEDTDSAQTVSAESQGEEILAAEIVKTPYNSNLGQLQKKYWRWTGSAFEYYDENGYYLSVPQLKKRQLAGNTYRGYYKIGNFYYALDDNGVPRTGDYEITEGIRQGLYYFYKEINEDGYPGAMAIKTWVHITTSVGERWRYYDGSGRTTLGVKVTKLDKTIDPGVGDYEYLLSYGGYRYKKVTMAKTADGSTYFCDARSVIYKDKVVTYNGARYYVTSNGTLATYKNGWRRLSCMNNRPYYFGSVAGRISEKTGWVKVTYSNGKFVWYLFTGNGNAYINTWRGNLYFDSYGALASGLKKVNGKWYYFKPSTSSTHYGSVYKNTVITYNGKKYYAGSDGALYQSKWAKINGNYYYFQGNGTLATSRYLSKDGVYGYVDSTGKYTNGWVVVNASTNKVRYLNPKAPGYLKNACKVIDGVRYYFDKDGYRVSDLTSYYPSGWKDDPVLSKLHNGGYAPYYLECDRVNGVITVYTDASKKIPIKTMRTSVGTSAYPTPTGTFRVHKADRWQLLMGPSYGQYGCFITIASNGIGIYTHSVASGTKDIYNLPTAAYDKLGTAASHGCMRLCVADAKWIYDNCIGAKFKIFDGTYQSQECDKGPLGRNPLVQRYGSGNFDPTDPAIVG